MIPYGAVASKYKEVRGKQRARLPSIGQLDDIFDQSKEWNRSAIVSSLNLDQNVIIEEGLEEDLNI